MWNLHREKMQWFSNQEKIEKGTWLNGDISYELIGLHRDTWSEDMIPESGGSCYSGTCHD